MRSILVSKILRENSISKINDRVLEKKDHLKIYGKKIDPTRNRAPTLDECKLITVLYTHLYL